MELRPGYKHTEAGVIPVDWDARKLGELVAFRTGPFGSALHKSDYTNDGIPVVNPMHIIDGQIFPTRTMTITESAAKKMSDFRLKRGDVIIGRRGDMGRCAVVRADHIGWLCGTGSMIIRPLPGFDSDFLSRVLSSQSVVATIEASSVGSTMINLNQGTLSGLVIQAPPFPEQRAIADALSDVDALINGLNQLIAKKRDVKKAAMQQLLSGQTRLPGFSGEWEYCRLDELGTWKGGMTPSMKNPSYWREGTVPWISSGDVKSVRLTTTGFSVTAFAVKLGTTTLLPANSIVIVTRSGILRKYLPVSMNMIPMAINQDIKALIPNEKVIPSYLLHTLIGSGDEILARCLKSGTTVESIEFPWLKAFIVPIPPLAEQTTIATVLSDMDAELAALETRREKIRDLKQGMTQQLLTGKIRLI